VLEPRTLLEPARGPAPVCSDWITDQNLGAAAQLVAQYYPHPARDFCFSYWVCSLTYPWQLVIADAF